MKNKIKKLLFDIKESIDSIESYLGDERDFNVYQSNKMLRRAIEREFEIIGEAMSRIERLDNKLNISAKKQIISMRNRVIHGYDKIDDAIVWGTIVRHLPSLKKEIQKELDWKRYWFDYNRLLSAAGWEALTEKMGSTSALKFILAYDRGAGNYTEFRKKIFKGKTVRNIIRDMKKEGFVWDSMLYGSKTEPDS